MIDQKWVGHRFPAHSWEVEKGRVRAFAAAIGDQRPECRDEQAAIAAGYRSLLAPPTLLNSGPLDVGATERLLATLGVDIAKILHGEQHFSYHLPICAGDVLTYESTITDVSAKKGSALEFVTQETAVTNAAGEHVALMRSVVVVVNK